MPNQPIDLVFLWHMHQPDYRDHDSGEFLLPWVYLHALKDYTDMAAHLERHPGVRGVVNFVPVLLDQLEDYADQFEHGPLRDPLLRMLVRESFDDTHAPERRFLLESCFRANHERMLTPYPSYQRLHDLYRLVDGEGEANPHYFSSAYYADLVTWYHLAWTGETERRREPLLAELMSKGAGFTLEDRRRLLDYIGATLRNLIPRYRALAQRGQIELSTTPHHHPLAPLLLDVASAHDAAPELPLPSSGAYPGGRTRVIAHLKSAAESHARRFGKAPPGLWPAEGAISLPFLQLAAAQGQRWAASSEGVLANSLRRAGTEERRENVLYHPWRLSEAPQLYLFFRDERLSDLIGFEYAKWHGRDAAQHFMDEVDKIRAATATSARTPVVSVILDGENAWEYYPYNGYYFFDDLYGLLEQRDNVRTTTFSDVVARGDTADPLPALVAGSWVYGTFSTWIGDADKNRAWDMLTAAKQSYDRVLASGRLDAESARRAEAQLAVCEGSDWFWWFGSYNPATSVALFDRLFRANLVRLYQLLHLPAPPQLDHPISHGHGAPESGGTMRRAT